MSGGLKQDAEEVVRSLGDVLLQLGCDTGWLVPNTAMNSGPLNSRIAQYQQHLDALELEITRAIAECKKRESAKQEPEEPVREEPVKKDPAEFAGVADDPGDMDFYNLNSADQFGVFDDMPGKTDDYGIMDEFF